MNREVADCRRARKVREGMAEMDMGVESMQSMPQSSESQRRYGGASWEGMDAPRPRRRARKVREGMAADGATKSVYASYRRRARKVREGMAATSEHYSRYLGHAAELGKSEKVWRGQRRFPEQVLLRRRARKVREGMAAASFGVEFLLRLPQQLGKSETSRGPFLQLSASPRLRGMQLHTVNALCDVAALRENLPTTRRGL